jgi:hypothetical protein
MPNPVQTFQDAAARTFPLDKAGYIAGPVADQRHPAAGQGGHHDFAGLPLRLNLPGKGVYNFYIEIGFPQVVPLTNPTFNPSTVGMPTRQIIRFSRMNAAD